jgi:hypothetical protein
MPTKGKPNITSVRAGWDERKKLSVWTKGQSPEGYDDKLWRIDTSGKLIKYTEYGNRDSEYGWEIDRINPKGGDDIGNLQPLFWGHFVAKGE